MPLPSRACFTCKQRRVKCDETLPFCKRCTDFNRECSGYPDEQELSPFRIENDYARGRPRKPRKAKARSNSQKQALGTSNQVALAKAPTALPSPVAALSLSLEEHASQFCLTYYAAAADPMPELVRSYAETVGTRYSQAQRGSVLQLSFAALSHAIFGQCRTTPNAISIGKKYYSQALAKCELTLRDPVNSASDDLMLAIMLMSHYENAEYIKPDREAVNQYNMLQSVENTPPPQVTDIASQFLRCLAHHDGAVAVLNHRRQKRGSAAPSEMDKFVRRHLLIIMILRGADIPVWLENGADFGEHGLALELDSLKIRVARLRFALTRILLMSNTGGAAAVQELQRLACDAQNIDNELAVWILQAPPDWEYSVSQLSEDDENIVCDLDEAPVHHHYRGSGHIAAWNRYRTLRLLVNDMYIKIADIGITRNLTLDTSDLTLAKSRMHKLSKDLCYAIASQIRQLRSSQNLRDGEGLSSMAHAAGLMAWPLATGSCLSGIPQPQKRLIRHYLNTVGHLTGDRILTTIAEGEISI